MITIALMAAQAVSANAATSVEVDGNLLQPGRSCYAIVANGQTIGRTVQTITVISVESAPSWQIEVHQKLDNGTFELRDTFVVKRDTLQPVSLRSERGTDRNAPGWQRVTVKYADGFVTGSKETAGGIVPLLARVPDPVWDGNLWGLMFAGLPLRDGASFQIPFWQYDKGLGRFDLQVKGSQMVQTPGSPIDAWVVEAGTDPARTTRYLIGKDSRKELGYSAGPMEQVLQDDCS